MADPKEILKTQPLAEGAGAGGWVPAKKTPVWAAVFIGTVFASAPAILVAFPDKYGALASAVLMGAAGSLATYFGMRSAGPRQP